MKGKSPMSLTEEELKKLHPECGKLPEGKDYQVDDYILNLFLTVLDFQMKSEVVESALDFYKEWKWGQT